MDTVQQDEQLEKERWFNFKGAWILSTLGIRGGDTVLDFGCGYGSYTLPARQVTGDDGWVIAVDKEREKLAATRQLVEEWGLDNRLEEKEGTEETAFADIKDDTIDAVLVFDVLQHVDDWELLFGNIKRILKPRGRLLLNPSKLSHPEKVDLEKLENILEKFQFHISMRRTYRLMHYKHFTEDEILLGKIT